MKVLIGSDKSGFALKEYLLEQLTALGYEVIDKGTPDLDHVMPFFAVAPVVAQAIQAGEGEKAILICGTGMGMSQVANKYPGILAACCESVYAARMCRAINNSNILCMGGWVIAPGMALEMAQTFLTTEHTQGLEEWRQEFLKNAFVKVQEIDQQTRK